MNIKIAGGIVLFTILIGLAIFAFETWRTQPQAWAEKLEKTGLPSTITDNLPPERIANQSEYYIALFDFESASQADSQNDLVEYSKAQQRKNGGEIILVYGVITQSYPANPIKRIELIEDKSNYKFAGSALWFISKDYLVEEFPDKTIRFPVVCKVVNGKCDKAFVGTELDAWLESRIGK